MLELNQELNMLEKDFNELDDDFITLYSRLFSTYPFEEVKKDMNFLATLGQYDALALHYEMKKEEDEDNEHLDSLLNKEISIVDMNSYNLAYAKLMKSECDLSLGKNQEITELIKTYNDLIESIYLIKKKILDTPNYSIKDKNILIKRLQEMENQKEYFAKKLRETQLVKDFNDLFWNGEKIIDKNNDNLIFEVKHLIYTHRIAKAYKSFFEFKFNIEICREVGNRLKETYKQFPNNQVNKFVYALYLQEFGNIIQKKLSTSKIFEELASRRLSNSFIHSLINYSKENQNSSNF